VGGDGAVIGNPTLEAVLYEIHAERDRQDAKWGEQNHRDGTATFPGADRRAADEARRECETLANLGACTWRAILTEEVAEAFAERDPAKLRAELIQVAAVAVSWVQAIDRREVES
jgi:hypothetical protein